MTIAQSIKSWDWRYICFLLALAWLVEVGCIVGELSIRGWWAFLAGIVAYYPPCHLYLSHRGRG